MEKYITKYIDIMVHWFSTYSLKVVAAILILIIGNWISRKISKIMIVILEKNKLDSALAGFMSSMIYYMLFILVMIAAAGQLGINTTSFLTIVGAAGLAIGLALKDSLSNFASGVMLILFRPFKTGDVINASGITGAVAEITIFNTILNTPDNQRIIVPNSNITTGVITNITANPTRRVDMVIGISYDDNIGQAKQLIEEILEKETRILDDPPPKVAVAELGDNSVNLAVRPWVKTADYWDVYFGITETIKLAFDEKGISFPFPQRDVHMYTEK